MMLGVVVLEKMMPKSIHERWCACDSSGGGWKYEAGIQMLKKTSSCLSFEWKR